MENEEQKDTICYTYRVDMVIQILAQNEAQASEKLDREGGFISKRGVTLVDYTLLPAGVSKSD
jgi:hypothetical protein